MSAFPSRPSRAPAPYPPRPYPAQPYRRAVYPRPRRRTSLWTKLFLAAFLAGLLLLPLAGVITGFAYFQVFGRILPGVHVGDSWLGGQTVQQAAVELHKTWNMERRLTVSDGLQSRTISPAQLGLSVDALLTAQTAYQVGHNQPVLVEADQMAYSLQHGWGIAPIVAFDPNAARAGLEALSAEMSLAPQDASLRLENGSVVIVPGKLGYTINVQDTMATLAADPRAILIDGSLRLALKPVLPRIEDVSAAKGQAERLLNTPLSLSAYDPIKDEHIDLPAPREVIASWLKVEPGENGPQIAIDESQVGAYLSSLSNSLGTERWLDAARYSQPLAQAVGQGTTYTMIVSHHPTVYTVQPGDTLLKIGWKLGMPYWKLVEANPGLNPDALLSGQELTVPSKDELLPLPVVANKRIVISISKQRLWVYQDGKQIGEHVISTGIDRSPTQPGVFQVQTHELNAYASVWNLYMPHFLGIYEAWPGFMNGIHGLPMLSNGRRLWANILGRPASYGCIILNLQEAEDLYNWAENGVVVEIKP